MPPKKYAVKGEPDFHLVSDEKLKLYLETVQQLIFSYKPHDSEKTAVLQEIFKEMSKESTQRLVDLPYKEENCSPSALIAKVPKLRKSPVKMVKK